LDLINAKAQLTAAAGTAGIVDYAKAQTGNASLNIVTEWQAMMDAIDAVGAQILSDVPTGAGGFRLVESWTASGISVRQFTTAQTASLRTALSALIATID